MPGIIILLKYPKSFFLFYRDVENVLENSVLRNCLGKYMQINKTMLNFPEVPPKFPLYLGEYEGKIILTWNLDFKAGIVFDVCDNYECQ